MMDDSKNVILFQKGIKYSTENINIEFSKVALPIAKAKIIWFPVQTIIDRIRDSELDSRL